ncbi:MAG: hypothetical protein KatS3mg060_3214 [Dehalococcoidia bacterium]|nr:MAG: hypothetical protein KatS3mg060_3214 [Dehalococcoidia bacterium]
MTNWSAIRATWVLAFDGEEHVVLEHGVVEWEDGAIVRVGREPRVPRDRVLNLDGHLLLPGLINLHCHAGSQAAGRLIFHQGRRDVFGGGFQNTAPRRDAVRPPRRESPGGSARHPRRIGEGWCNNRP